MGVALNTAGVTVGYAVEASAGTRPTTNYIEIPDIKEVPEMNPEPENIGNYSFKGNRVQNLYRRLKGFRWCIIIFG